MNISRIALAAGLAAASARSAAAMSDQNFREPEELAATRSEFAALRGAPASKPADVEPSATQKLMNTGRADLEALYRRSEPGPVPDGESNGLAAIAPHTPLGALTETLFSVFWRGKVFDRKSGTLVNKIFGARVVKAKVFIGPSLLDGKPSVIIDYQGTSWIAGAIRDEIRLVAPGVYLGLAYVRSSDDSAPHADIVFALDFNRNDRAGR